MKFYVSITLFIILALSSFKPKATFSYTNVEQNYCAMLDTLVLERYTWKSGNYFSNRILPKIINKSKIDANCDRGTLGYLYKSDSTFNADIEKWREYFKCK